MQDWLRTFWFESKDWLKVDLGIEGHHAHIYVGLVLFFAAAMLFRRHKHQMLWAWLFVFVLQSVNELLDARDWIYWTGMVNWSETSADYAATLFWPTTACFTWITYLQMVSPQWRFRRLS